MQRKTTTALAALMALGIAGGASAQSLGASADVNAGAGDNGSVAADVGVGADASVAKSDNAAGAGASKEMGTDMSVASANSGVKTYGQLVSSLRTSDTMNADLSGFDAETDVAVTALSELQGEAAENGAALDDILSERNAEIEEMRSNITANADLAAALEAEGYSADDVVAMETHGDSGVTFFVDDTM